MLAQRRSPAAAAAAAAVAAAANDPWRWLSRVTRHKTVRSREQLLTVIALWTREEHTHIHTHKPFGRS